MSKDEIDAMIEEGFNATLSSERRRLAELESTALEQIKEDQLDLLTRA